MGRHAYADRKLKISAVARTGGERGRLAVLRLMLLVAAMLVVGYATAGIVVRGAMGRPAQRGATELPAIQAFPLPSMSAAAGATTPSRPTTPWASASFEPIDWAAILGALDATRNDAFENATPAELENVYADGSAPLDAERATLAALAADGLRPRGLRLALDSVEPVVVTPGHATLVVTDRLAPYSVVDSDGAVVEASPGRGSAMWRVDLVQERGSWQIADVEQCADPVCSR